MKELRAMSVVELLQAHSAVIGELHRQNVVKTGNNPLGDYTEWVVCKRLGLQVEGNSRAGFDATDREGTRYQIKGRRSEDNSVQFSPIRKLEDHRFDFVIAVTFNKDYSVRLAIKVSHDAVPTLSRYQAYINGHNLNVTRNAVEQDGVEDITHLLV